MQSTQAREKKDLPTKRRAKRESRAEPGTKTIQKGELDYGGKKTSEK